jgi:hypothetical protein
MRSVLGDRIYSSADLCALIPGVSARKLQWLDEQGCLKPDRAGGRNRRYRIEDALTIAIIVDLRMRGLSLQRIRAIVRRIRLEAGRLIYLVSNGQRPYLLIDGKSLSIELLPARILDELSTSKRHCFVVNVQDRVAIFEKELHKRSFRQAV